MQADESVEGGVVVRRRTPAIVGVAIVLGALAAIGMIFVVGVFFAIPAVILGHVALSRISGSGGTLGGKGTAVTAVSLGYLSIVGSFVTLALIVCVVVPGVRRGVAPRSIRDDVSELRRMTEAEQEQAVVDALSAGDQRRAEDMLRYLRRKTPDNHRLAFMQAVCSRSRWAIGRAEQQMKEVIRLAPDSPEARCAQCVIDMDRRERVRSNMFVIADLMKAHPEDPFFPWIMGIECREDYKRGHVQQYSEQGASAYRLVLDLLDPGPVLVHQTYANILSDQLKRHEEALPHRRMAVELEPSAWTYQGLGNTLSRMKRFDEANAAFAEMVTFAPEGRDYWLAWARSLKREENYEAAIEKYRRVMDLGDEDAAQVWNEWGHALEKLERHKEALAIYDKSLLADPDNQYAIGAVMRLTWLLRQRESVLE